MKSCITLLVLLCCACSCKLEILNEDHKLGEQTAVEVQSEDESNSKNIHGTEEHDEADLPSNVLTCREKTCKIDVTSALLIHMSTSLAEQRAELRNTKTEMSTLEARLRAELRNTKTEMSTLEARLRAELRNTKTEMSTLEARLRASEKLIEHNEGSKVVFSASLLGPYGSSNIGPVNTRITLIYRNVYTNIGKAYNPNTGIFTAPVKGVYHFTLYIYAHSSSAHPTTTSLMKNGHQVLIAHGHQTGPHTVNSSNGVSLVLEAGDVVFVQLWENRIIFDNINCHSTFSGHLLFTL